MSRNFQDMSTMSNMSSFLIVVDVSGVMFWWFVKDIDPHVFNIHGYDFLWSVGVEHFAEVWLGTTEVCHSRWTFTACTGQESCASAAILMAGQGQTVTWGWQKDQLRNAAISGKLACDRKSGENAILFKLHWVLKLSSRKFEYKTHVYCTWGNWGYGYVSKSDLYLEPDTLANSCFATPFSNKPIW